MKIEAVCDINLSYLIETFSHSGDPDDCITAWLQKQKGFYMLSKGNHPLMSKGRW